MPNRTQRKKYYKEVARYYSGSAPTILKSIPLKHPDKIDLDMRLAEEEAKIMEGAGYPDIEVVVDDKNKEIKLIQQIKERERG